MFALRFIRPKVVRPCPTCFRAASTTTITPATSHLRPFAYGTAVVIAGGAFIAYYSDSRSGIHQYVLAPLLTTVLDGEEAHKLALRTLRSGLHPRDPLDDDARLKVQIWDNTLVNPIGLAAGFDKDGEVIDALCDLGFSWIEIGSVTPEPQEGNAKPRVFHLVEDQAVINRYGFPSKGAASVVARLQARFPDPLGTGFTLTKKSEDLPASLKQGTLLSVNLGKNKSSPPDSIDDFLFGVRTFAAVSDVLVVNVSSPNTPGLRKMQSRGMLIELLGALVKERAAITQSELPCRRQKQPKLLLKIAPDLSEAELEDVAEAVLVTGIDGVVISNNTVQRPVGLKSKNQTETGGLSGPPLKPLTLRALRTLRRLLPASIPLIGCGGISTGQDAIEFARAGATIVQLYTAFAYNGVGTPRRIKDEVTQILEAQGRTWMDVVKEAQLAALQENKPKKKEVLKEKTKLADRAGKVLAAGSDVVKEVQLAALQENKLKKLEAQKEKTKLADRAGKVLATGS